MALALKNYWVELGKFSIIKMVQNYYSEKPIFQKIYQKQLEMIKVSFKTSNNDDFRFILYSTSAKYVDFTYSSQKLPEKF